MLGEIKSVADLAERSWRWHQVRRDPARVQAARLIVAFEVHGVKRQQIARLLPMALLEQWKLSIADFSTPKG